MHSEAVLAKSIFNSYLGLSDRVNTPAVGQSDHELWGSLGAMVLQSSEVHVGCFHLVGVLSIYCGLHGNFQSCWLHHVTSFPDRVPKVGRDPQEFIPPEMQESQLSYPWHVATRTLFKISSGLNFKNGGGNEKPTELKWIDLNNPVGLHGPAA